MKPPSPPRPPTIQGAATDEFRRKGAVSDTTDASHELRLFTNLLQNAVQHTPASGTVTVAAAVDAQSVVVTVTETGEGIPPEHLPFLGERFYRVDAARAAEKGSAGLGLAICRSIVQARSGKMTIESNGGQGTTVWIRLPRQHPKQRPQQ